MVLGILTAIAACPAIIGTTEAVRQGQKANARERHRGQKAHMVVNLPKKNSYSARFDDSRVVLWNDKLYIQLSTSRFQSDTSDVTPPHPFTGYYYPYPSQQSTWKSAGWVGEGLVSTTSDDPPFLNWLYVDRHTLEVKHGVRVQAEPHIVGPWDLTQGMEKRVTFEGWEGFVAVQEDEERDLWALYFDKEDDGLTTEEGMIGRPAEDEGRKRMLLVELTRKEIAKTREMAQEERVERLRQIAQKEKIHMENTLVEEYQEAFEQVEGNDHVEEMERFEEIEHVNHPQQNAHIEADGQKHNHILSKDDAGHEQDFFQRATEHAKTEIIDHRVT